MTADDLRAIMAFLREKVELKSMNPIEVTFTEPSKEKMVQAELNQNGIENILSADWWDDMVTDIIETPDFCEQDDSPEDVLEYAKDVVSDYLRKRVKL